MVILTLMLFFRIIYWKRKISHDGVHSSVSHGIPKRVINVRNFYVNRGLTVSETEIKPRIISHFFGKNFDHYDNNFFCSRPKQTFLPRTHYNIG